MRVTTTAPLPVAADWGQLISGKDYESESLRAVWQEETSRTVWFSRGAWTFHAMTLALQETLGRSPVIWFPDYFCHQPLGPLGVTDARVVFYPIDAELDPDWNACDRMAEADKPDVFVIVHYFGFAADTARAREFADRSGALLFEDAAHAIGPTPEIGRAGDFVLFSLYKHFPLPDGAALLIRDAASALKDIIVDIAEDDRISAPSSSQWIVKRAIQSLVPSIGNVSSTPARMDEDPPVTRLMFTPVISKRAQRLLRQKGDRLDIAIKQRRENATALYGLFDQAEGLTALQSKGKDAVVPYRAVFRASDHETAIYWYRRIRESGNVVESWPDLPPDIRANPDRHQVAIGLRNTILCLPIHADRTADQLQAAYGAAL